MSSEMGYTAPVLQPDTAPVSWSLFSAALIKCFERKNEKKKERDIPFPPLAHLYVHTHSRRLLLRPVNQMAMSF